MLTVSFFTLQSSFKDLVPPCGFYTQTSESGYLTSLCGRDYMLFAADTKHCQGRMAPGGRNDDTNNQAVSHLLFVMASILLFSFFKSSGTAFHSQSNCPVTSLILSHFLLTFVVFFPTLSPQHLVISISLF